MKIECLTLPETFPAKLKQRCSRLVTSCGTAYFGDRKNVCAKHARFKFDGVPLCGLHAGEAALAILVKQRADV